jgi:guanylate kinase
LVQGKLIIFSAPSGSGKTTLVHRMLQEIPGLSFSVSACTRPPREGEVHGRDYYFLSVREFMQSIENDEFIEWEMVYEGKYYGTLRREAERIWNEGKHVVFDVDVEGGLNLKEKFGQRALSIFVMPPSLEILAQRLRARGTETEVNLAMRVEKARTEMEYASRFDTIILNDDLERAVAACRQAILHFLGR